MLRPSALALYRLIVAESARFPELGGAIYAVGAGRMLGLLADYLAWESRNGRLSVADPELAAEQFVGMLTGRMQRSEEHTSELQSLMRISYAVFCLTKKKIISLINEQR